MQLAKATAKKTEGSEEAELTVKKAAPGTVADDEEMDLVENVERDFQVSLGKFYVKVAAPKPSLKEWTAEEMLYKHLRKGPRANAEAADKKAKVETLKSTIATLTCETSKKVLQAQVDEFEAQIEATTLQGSEQARAVADKAAYATAIADINKETADKKAMREKKTVESERNSEEFLAANAEAHAKLARLEKEFIEIRNTARREWEERNKITDAVAEATIQLATQRMADADKLISPTQVAGTPASIPKQQLETAPQLPIPTTNGTATTATAPLWYRQKTHYVSIEPTDMVDTDAISWDNVNMGEVHKAWYVLQEIQLQPPCLADSYEMFGISAATLETIIGKPAMTKIFGEADKKRVAIVAQDAVPDQLINLLRMQMQKLSARLQGEREDGKSAEAHADANAAIAKDLPIRQEERKKRGARPY
jgi:hypothetical protein